MKLLCDTGISLIDSMPVMICSGKWSGKVAREITTGDSVLLIGIYYYGLKLHALGFRGVEGLPFPKCMLATEASVNDLSSLKDIVDFIHNRILFGNKIYGGQRLLGTDV
jgi:hypothetical protein